MSLVSKPRTRRKSCFTCRPSGEQGSRAPAASLPHVRQICRVIKGSAEHLLLPVCLLPRRRCSCSAPSCTACCRVHRGLLAEAGREQHLTLPQSELWFLSSSALLGLQAQQPGLCLHCCCKQLPLAGLWWLPWLLPLAQTWGNPAPCGFFSF